MSRDMKETREKSGLLKRMIIAMLLWQDKAAVVERQRETLQSDMAPFYSLLEPFNFEKTIVEQSMSVQNRSQFGHS